MRYTSKKLFLRVNGTYEAVELNAISHAQAEGDYVTLYVDQEKSYLLRLSLSKLDELLPLDRFLRIHRSFLVNVDRIIRIDPKENTISLEGHTTSFPLNRSCREQLFSLINRIN